MVHLDFSIAYMLCHYVRIALKKPTSIPGDDSVLPFHVWIKISCSFFLKNYYRLFSWQAIQTLFQLNHNSSVITMLVETHLPLHKVQTCTCVGNSTSYQPQTDSCFAMLPVSSVRPYTYRDDIPSMDRRMCNFKTITIKKNLVYETELLIVQANLQLWIMFRGYFTGLTSTSTMK